MSQLLSQTEINDVHLQFLLNPIKHMQCLQVTTLFLLHFTWLIQKP